MQPGDRARLIVSSQTGDDNRPLFQLVDSPRDNSNILTLPHSGQVIYFSNIPDVMRLIGVPTEITAVFIQTGIGDQDVIIYEGREFGLTEIAQEARKNNSPVLATVGNILSRDWLIKVLDQVSEC